jgi:formylglycine-generating enzyme required for sulfatase activity/serine/threonine protein phosphatase PrpC
MSVDFDIASDQIDGARDYQEDAYMVSQLGETDDGKNCALVIMADGMGGHAAGNVASNMVVATFNKSFQSEFPSKQVPESLTSALHRANQQIADSIRETPALRGMGCTMVSAYLEGNKLYWASVGDSHLYLVRDRELIKQNADHSYGAYIDMMKEQGMEIEEQPGMSRNMLMSAMTGEEISSIDCPDSPIKVRPGDRLIVASDGLDTLGAGAIIQYSSWSKTARECVYALLKAVEEANKINQDNTTIIVVDIHEKASPVSEQPSTRESLSKAAEVSTVETAIAKPDRSGLVSLLVKLVIVAILAGAGFFAWQQGLVDKLISGVGEKVEQLNREPDVVIEAPEPIKPEQTESVETTPRALVKQPPQPDEPEPLVQEQYVDKPDPFTDPLKSGGNGPVMIHIPGGNFRMGNATGLLSADETPRHGVNVKPFVMSVYEVTFAEYDRFARATGRKSPDSGGLDRKSYPVTDISWDEALAYTRWLKKQTGKNYRLPSEAEWEYAARAGTRTTYWWGTQKGVGNAHCFDCGSDLNINRPARVGAYKPNQFGLYDTAANVYEWVHDCYHRNYQGAPDDGSVWEGGDCSVRVARGGSFRSPASSMRVENRESFAANKGHFNVGLRLARDL